MVSEFESQVYRWFSRRITKVVPFRYRLVAKFLGTQGIGVLVTTSFRQPAAFCAVSKKIEQSLKTIHLLNKLIARCASSTDFQHCTFLHHLLQGSLDSARAKRRA